MNLSKSFELGFRKMSESFVAQNAGQISDSYVESVQNQIDSAIKNMNQMGSTDKLLPFKKGDIAEEWHGGTANIRATARGKLGDEYQVPRDHSPNDIVQITPKGMIYYQIKYYNTPEATAKAISDPKYRGLGKIVPSDQLEGVKESAYRLYQKNLNSRPEVAKEYLDTYNNATDKLPDSTPLDEKNMYNIAKQTEKGTFDGKQYGLVLVEYIEWSDIWRKTGGAALNAMIITTVLKVAPHLIDIIMKIIKEEHIDESIITNMGKDVISGSIEGTIRGAITAFFAIGIESGHFGGYLQNLNIHPNIIAMITVITIGTMKNSFQLKKGNITHEEFVDKCLRDSIVVVCGILGGSAVQTLIPIPILGMLIGNFVGSVIASIVYDTTKQVCFSFFIKSGVSFFKIVNQDYTLPDEVLRQVGFDLIEFEEVEFEEVKFEEVEFEEVEFETIDIYYLKRGLIGVNTIGYI